MDSTIPKGVRVSGKAREQLVKNFVKAYNGGASIRAIAAESGRSYGFVQGALKSAGVEFRPRGGAVKKPAASTSKLKSVR